MVNEIKIRIVEKWRDRLEALTSGALGEKIARANEEAADMVINADPVWVDVRPAGEVVEGLGDYTVTHSGPPISFDDMVHLHQRGMVSACLFEGWAKTEEEALELIRSGKLKMISALDTNTVGSGTGIITKSVAMVVVRDRNNGKIAATFPPEGIVHQGGFCGWGLYSEGIAENLRIMRERLLPPMAEAVRRMGGLPLKEILVESLQMGDENHTRQTASSLLLKEKLLQEMLKLDITRPEVRESMQYLLETPRFFHCLSQGYSRAAMLGNVGREYSTVVTAACGNGVEFGIKIAAMGDEWFTAPAPMIKGKYTSPEFTAADQIPWCGDSSVGECAGLGAVAGAASPIVCRLRNRSITDSIAQTRKMKDICVKDNPNFPIPNLDYECLPVGFDALKVLENNTQPMIHGGMFNKEGGLLGAGAALIPMACFEKAVEAFIKKYGV